MVCLITWAAVSGQYGGARLYVSQPILDEYEDVLARPELKIRKGLRRQLLQPETLRKRGYCTLRIPESVLNRVHQRLHGMSRRLFINC